MRIKSYYSEKKPNEPTKSLKRVLSLSDLMAIGIGTIVGAGIFVSMGTAISKAGPSIIISCILAGMLVILVALPYSELASITPISGSAYTYTYTTVGEIPAFFVGWNLSLEFILSMAALAVGWSSTLETVTTHFFNLKLADWLTFDGHFNVAAVAIILVITAVVLAGISITAKVVKLILLLTITVIGLVVIFGMGSISVSNLTPFFPRGTQGMVSGAALVFFAYIGFDVVANNAEEAKNPKRQIPIAIIGSVLVAMILFVLMVTVQIGNIPFKDMNFDSPLSQVMDILHHGWVATIVSVGTLIILIKGMLTVLSAQSRIIFSMGRDRILPKFLENINSNKVPTNSIYMTSILSIIVAGFVPLGSIIEMVNIGGLFSYIIVIIGVYWIRKNRPELKAPFRTPFFPVIGTLGILGSIWMILNLQPLSWLRFIVWSAVGAIIYFGYSRRTSLVGRQLVKSR